MGLLVSWLSELLKQYSLESSALNWTPWALGVVVYSEYGRAMVISVSSSPDLNNGSVALPLISELLRSSAAQGAEEPTVSDQVVGTHLEFNTVYNYYPGYGTGPRAVE